MRIVISVVMLALFVGLAQDASGTLTPGQSVVLETGTTSPSDTTIAWINTAWPGMAIWDTACQAWVEAQGETWEFSVNGATANVALKFGDAANSDTTSAAADGFCPADSVVITGYEFTSASENTVSQDFILYHGKAAGPDTMLTLTMTATQQDADGLAVFLAGGTGRYSCYGQAAANPSTRPNLRFRVRRFVR